MADVPGRTLLNTDRMYIDLAAIVSVSGRTLLNTGRM